MKLLRYNNFKNLDILLEANIKFSDEFREVLNGVDNPLAKKLIDIENKEVDVDTNYINLSKDDNFIQFKSDKKVNSNTAKVLLGWIEEYGPYYGSLYSIQPSEEWSKKLTSIIFDIRNVFSFFFDIMDKTIKYKKIEKGDFINELKKIDPSKWENIKWDFNYTNIKKYTAEEVADILYTDDYGGGACYEIETFNGKKGIVHSFGKYPILLTDERKLKPQELRVGSFTKTILNKSGIEVDNRDLEDFVTKWGLKVKEKYKDLFKNFQVVKGEEIRFYYHENNYYKPAHTLGNSCMRYPKCQAYLNIYTENPNSVNLIILKSEEDPNKIIGRALLWLDPIYLDDDDEEMSLKTPFQDRIYVSNSKDEQLFIKYAKKMGYTWRSGKSEIIYNGENVLSTSIKIKLEKCDFKYYPYMDTLCYLDYDYKILTNDDSILDGSYSTLQQTNGLVDDLECEMCGGNGEVDCPDCYGDGEVDCSTCDGSGEIDGESCSDCQGGGRVECDNCHGGGEIDCPECG